MAHNIVLVTVDSLRADHCSFMGYERETTPTLDAMADDGVVFERAVAPGPTTPESMPAIFTGEFPVAAGGTGGLADAQHRLRSHLHARDSFPEKLSRRGYSTAAFTPNPWTSRYFGFDSGFDHFEDFMGDDLSSPLWDRMLERNGSKPLAAARLALSWAQRENVFKPWSAFYDDIDAWVRDASEPYFLWVFLLDVHFPYLAGASHRTQSRWREYEANLRLYLQDQHTPYSPRIHEQLVTAYDDAIRFTDAFFERLRSDLDDPVVVVHGDHGEAFGEHGTYTHQHQLYRENVHVPLVISGPPGGRVSDPVSLRALPRILTGIAETGRVPSVDELFVVSETSDGAQTALAGPRAKYIRNGTDSALYDLRRGEHDPVTNDQLEGICERFLARHHATRREHARITRATTEVANDR